MLEVQSMLRLLPARVQDRTEQKWHLLTDLSVYLRVSSPVPLPRGNPSDEWGMTLKPVPHSTAPFLMLSSS